jgi:hypothetical protein
MMFVLVLIARLGDGPVIVMSQPMRPTLCWEAAAIYRAALDGEGYGGTVICQKEVGA